MELKDDFAVFMEIVRAISDVESLTTLVPALERRWSTPPTALLSAAFGRPCAEAEVRRILFAPQPSDMSQYVAMLAGDATRPRDLSGSAHNRVQAAALGHLFLVHGRIWERLRPLIENDGLRCAHVSQPSVASSQWGSPPAHLRLPNLAPHIPRGLSALPPATVRSWRCWYTPIQCWLARRCMCCTWPCPQKCMTGMAVVAVVAAVAAALLLAAYTMMVTQRPQQRCRCLIQVQAQMQHCGSL